MSAKAGPPLKTSILAGLSRIQSFPVIWITGSPRNKAYRSIVPRNQCCKSNATLGIYEAARTARPAVQNLGETLGENKTAGSHSGSRPVCFGRHLG